MYTRREGYPSIMGSKIQKRLEIDHCRTFNILWSIQVLTEIFWLEDFLNRLATKDQQIKIGLIFSINGGTCVLCSQAEEDFNHLLFDCPISSKIWDSMGVWSGCYVSFIGVSWKHCLAWCGMFNNHTRSVKVDLIWLSVVWCLWKIINDIIFNDDLCNLNDII